MGQSVLNASMQDNNSYTTSPSPSQQFTPDFSGQGMLNASIPDDNSSVGAPPSPTMGSDCGQGMDFNDANSNTTADGFDDQDAAIF